MIGPNLAAFGVQSLQEVSNLVVMMKLALMSEIVFEMFREMVGTDRHCD